MNKKTKLWIFNFAMLALFLFAVVIPINDGKTLFKTGMDKIMGVTSVRGSSED